MEEYNANKINKDPDFFVKYQSTRRTFSSQDYFVLDTKTYDAYEKDIALVEVFFRKSTVIQMGKVIWLCLRIIARKLDMADWFP